MGSILLLVLLSACSATDDPGSSEENPPKPERSRGLRVERISAGAPGQGPQRPQVIVAPSANVLSGETGVRIPDSGGGAYLAAYRGEQPTGGYSVDIGAARVEGNRVTVRLLLKGPPEGAIVTQVLTYPYVVAVIRNVEGKDTGFSFVDQDGRKLDWPVRRAGG